MRVKAKSKGRKLLLAPLGVLRGRRTLHIPVPLEPTDKAEARRRAEELEAFLQDLLARKGLSRGELEAAWEEAGR
ncbi:hypothetical protein [Thermus hydrothermalis]|uniref:hypothetical protein n=1 Tax=Thermus hydrothermalis TaxID=2908148 RepID=UPI001FAABBE4|nr:hypothetical protein [Thermus hydrothermalis]